MLLVVSLFLNIGAADKLDAAPERVVINHKASDASMASVRVAKANAADEMPILGEWTAGDTLTFTPRIPFERGVKYHVIVPGVIDSSFTLQAKEPKPGRVEAIEPRADKLPANVLRFYVHFDQPMKPGQGFQHIKLFEATGKEITEAFLELQEELWNADGTRLTVFLNPGRIKKDLEPNRVLGPVLKTNQQYILVIHKEFKTLDGQPLAKVFRKSFTTTAEVEQGLDSAKWVVTPPAAGTRVAVKLKFDALMDSALMSRVVKLDSTLAGERIAQDEWTWAWQPKDAWKAGRNSIVIDDTLEDVCGNRIGAAFDAKLGTLGVRAKKDPTRLTFEIK